MSSRRNPGSLVHVLALYLAAAASAPVYALEDLIDSQQFDCVDAYDLARYFTTISCQANSTEEKKRELFERAKRRLTTHGFFAAREFRDIELHWCKLNNAAGFTADAHNIYLDAGLYAGGPDLVAETIAHEMIHIRQFHQLGETEFKCTYITALLQCGGCQDRGHAMEAEAYRFQDRVRQQLLQDWLDGDGSM